MKTKQSLNVAIVRVMLITAAILIIPLIFNWPWTPSDFIVAGSLIFAAAFMLDLIIRKGGKYKIPAALAIIFSFLWLWAELAVGLFTGWGN